MGGNFMKRLFFSNYMFCHGGIYRSNSIGAKISPLTSSFSEKMEFSNVKKHLNKPLTTRSDIILI